MDVVAGTQSLLSKGYTSRIEVERAELIAKLNALNAYMGSFQDALDLKYDYLEKYISNYGKNDPYTKELQRTLDREEKYKELLDAQVYDMEHYAAILYDRIRLLESL